MADIEDDVDFSKLLEGAEEGTITTGESQSKASGKQLYETREKRLQEFKKARGFFETIKNQQENNPVEAGDQELACFDPKVITKFLREEMGFDPEFDMDEFDEQDHRKSVKKRMRDLFHKGMIDISGHKVQRTSTLDSGKKVWCFDVSEVEDEYQKYKNKYDIDDAILYELYRKKGSDSLEGDSWDNYFESDDSKINRIVKDINKGNLDITLDKNDVEALANELRG